MKEILSEIVSRQDGILPDERINNAILELTLRQNILLEEFTYKVETLLNKIVENNVNSMVAKHSSAEELFNSIKKKKLETEIKPVKKKSPTKKKTTKKKEV